MTTMTAAPASVQAPPFGNWTRFLLTVKDHEEWIFESTEFFRSDTWWDKDFSSPPTLSTSNSFWGVRNGGWVKVDGKAATDFTKYQSPFFQTPYEVYKLLRACMRRHNNGANLTHDKQKEIWAWAFENLIVYELTFNMHTLTATKKQINFKKECCPKSISRVN